jgi:hypothetical protein
MILSRRTGKERMEGPMYWVKDPLTSVVFELQADLRLIFAPLRVATAFTLRFPRIYRVRGDKGALDVGHVRDLAHIVSERKGSYGQREGAKSGGLSE